MIKRIKQKLSIDTFINTLTVMKNNGITKVNLTDIIMGPTPNGTLLFSAVNPVSSNVEQISKEANIIIIENRIVEVTRQRQDWLLYYNTDNGFFKTSDVIGEDTLTPSLTKEIQRLSNLLKGEQNGNKSKKQNK